ncbi:major facilitator superfamily protein [Truncatella angustata]|uniref:Major facilitator superfamily protein n=1 Tax=Truncatella angustata TaxID=152316 RepID=A0A9P8UQ37_9PEZI|nr:major facilitator superfamily protein [Truncatella angustata]KAH6656051.1 major facilitator superfamily protein [Truncatella angustata]
MDENLDENAVRELEEVLHTKIYPGTEIMKDVGTHHFVKAGQGSASVLVPQPSDDPHDPLNWSVKWKVIAMFTATMLSIGLNLGPLANAPMFEEYMVEWNCSLADAIQFTGVAILVLGFSNFIWIPISVCFGRRPVLIFSSLLCAISSIWRARATSYNSFMGASVLNGIGAGPCETIQPQIIADIMFLHDRGKYNTLYFSMYFGSLMVGPIIAGAMASNVGWRNFWWLNTALLILCVILAVFCFPETRYYRTYKSEEAVVSSDKALTTMEEKKDPGIPGTNIEDGDLAPVMTHVDPWLGRGKPSKLQFKLFQAYEGSIFRELWVPWYLHLFPIVEFASFVVSWSASGYLVVNLSQSQAFAAPPYNYSSQTIGLFNLAVLAGAIIGLFTNGPWCDWVADYFTKRNHGIREPEMRLPAMIPYILIMIVGSVVTAVGYDNHWPWQVIVIVGWGCLGIQVAALPAIASTYAIDSYKPVTGSLFVAITVNKNLWGYGVGKFLTPWVEESGFKVPILVNMALAVVFCSFGIVFWIWGKKFRGMTKDSFVHRL